MTQDQDKNPDLDEQVDALINEYFDRRQNGEDITPESFAAEHQYLAEQLRPCLEGLSFLDQIGLSDNAEPPETEVPESDTELPHIEGFNLIQEIGRGGMGVVYKAVQQSTNRIVALKIMLSGPFASPTAKQRFKREVELAARLEHPALARVLESGRTSGLQYYAMDFVDGVSLKDYVYAEPMETRELLTLFRSVCDGVQYAHSHRVIHRDLKPANILIDREGQPRILDFGLAKGMDQSGMNETLTTAGSEVEKVMGTLPYLSPEQAAGVTREIDIRTDVYALGVILYELLTGVLPVDTKGLPSQIIERISEGGITSPSSVSPKVDGELDTIILKSLEKDKNRRYQSVAELADDIDLYLAGEPIHACRSSGFYILRKKFKRHRVAGTAILLAAALALVAIPLQIWWQRNRVVCARQVALNCMQNIEGRSASEFISRINAALRDYNDIPDVRLVSARAMHERPDISDSGTKTLEQAVLEDPSHWYYRLLLSALYRESGLHEQADEMRQQAESEAPNTADGWYMRSLCTLSLTEARNCVERAVQIDSSHTLAWSRLTVLRLRTGDIPGASQGADQLISMGYNPGSWKMFKNRLLIRQHKFDQALAECNRVINAKPGKQSDADLSNAYWNRAVIYRRLKRYAEAVADYDKRLLTDNRLAGEAWNRYQRATLLWILGRTDDALVDYARVRVLLGYPFYSDARRYLILKELKRDDEAQGILSAALNDARNPSWTLQIFRCLAGKISPEELVEEAIERENEEHECEANYYAGEVYLLKNQKSAACRHFEQCVMLGVDFDFDAIPLSPMNEYDLARWRLDTLNGTGNLNGAGQLNKD